MSKFRFSAGLAGLLTFFAAMTGGVWAQSCVAPLRAR